MRYTLRVVGGTDRYLSKIHNNGYMDANAHTPAEALKFVSIAGLIDTIRRTDRRTSPTFCWDLVVLEAPYIIKEIIA